MTKLTNISGLLSAAALALGVSACGSDKPDIEQIKADFQNPSGLTANQQAVMAANGARDGSSPAISLASEGAPGQALRAAGSLSGFDRLSLRRMAEQRGKDVLRQRAGLRTQGLSTAQFEGEGCADSAEAQAAFGRLYAGESSASYSMDLSSCSDGEMTGSVDVSIELEGDANSGRFLFEQTFNDVCTVADGSCLTGTMIMEMLASSTGFELTFGWDFDGNWTDEAGVARSGNMKGGMRLTGSDSNATFEFLAYVTTPEGDEWSFVFGGSAELTGEGSLYIRGADGRIDCTFAADGSGTCSDDQGNEISWTAEEAASIDDSWYED